jgi:hypothetical protein
MRRVTVGLALAMLAAGCGTAIEYTELNTPPGPMQPRDPGSVEVFTTSRPARPFTEVGLIESQQESGLSTDGMAEIIQQMRIVAGERGCDALIISGANDAVVGHANNDHGHVQTLKGYRGACVVYTGEAPPMAPSPAQAASPAPAAPGSAASNTASAPAAPTAGDAAKTAPPAPAP